MSVEDLPSPTRWRQLLVGSGQQCTMPGNRTHAVTMVTTGWMITGLFLDAWAHIHVPQLESFFTPWHAVFYSGFAATATWIAWGVVRNVRAGRRGLAAVPTGHGLALLGLALFALAGLGDYSWHTVFGIEQSWNILFGPTHLLLAASGVAIVTSPHRSAWADPSIPAATPPSWRLPRSLWPPTSSCWRRCFSWSAAVCGRLHSARSPTGGLPRWFR